MQPQGSGLRWTYLSIWVTLSSVTGEPYRPSASLTTQPSPSTSGETILQTQGRELASGPLNVKQNFVMGKRTGRNLVDNLTTHTVILWILQENAKFAGNATFAGRAIQPRKSLRFDTDSSQGLAQILLSSKTEDCLLLLSRP